MAPTLRAIEGAFVVKMPATIGISEAILVAVVRAGAAIRYFTLEHSAFGTSRF